VVGVGQETHQPREKWQHMAILFFFIHSLLDQFWVLVNIWMVTLAQVEHGVVSGNLCHQHVWTTNFIATLQIQIIPRWKQVFYRSLSPLLPGNSPVIPRYSRDYRIFRRGTAVSGNFFIDGNDGEHSPLVHTVRNLYIRIFVLDFKIVHNYPPFPSGR
jgi:hypothetical protein